ncbi:Soluble guanylate cyclase gcy-35 [Aphelenchoides fujianensis]|nr:Soluble guanylate cyclase gcy-35 [Aphelenchoides fujianensis]
MHGWVHESLRQLITRKYGADVWQKILHVADFDEGAERDENRTYRDEETFRLVEAIARAIGVSMEEAWEMYGSFLIQYTMETGWDELLRAMAVDLEGFLSNLDSLHYFIDQVVFRSRLKGPSFRCEAQADGSLLLHYYSRRTSLFPIVKGAIRELARRLFGAEITIEMVDGRRDETDSLTKEHVTFRITQSEGGLHVQVPRLITTKYAAGAESTELVNSPEGYSITITDFCQAFPHHFCFDHNLTIEHVGIHMKKQFSFIKRGETKLTDILHLTHPEIPLTFESISTFRNSMFVFQMKEATKASGGPVVDLSISQFPITLKGAMVTVDEGRHLIFMCSLNVSSIRELMDRSLFISDIQRHDSTRDLIMLNQSRLSQMELNRRLEETTRNLKKMAVELEAEKEKTENLLCELMPATVAESLRQGNTVEASEFPETTILFTDIVTFTNICAQCTPYDVVNMLNSLYLRFDHVVGLHEVYKVETIDKWPSNQELYFCRLGDAFMIAGGCPNESPLHAERVLNTSIAMLMESKYVHSPITQKPIRIRLGVHTGPVVAGVVGIKMPRYCLFGETVHVANRMESTGVPNRIHVSKLTRNLALNTNPGFQFTDRGQVEILGKELQLHTFFLEKNDRRSVWELCGRERLPEHSLDGYLELHREIIKLLGKGGFGAVFEVKSKEGHHFAAKCETSDVLSMDCRVLRGAHLIKSPHFCSLVARGKMPGRFRFIIMKLVGNNLWELRNQRPDRRFSLNTSLKLAEQCLDEVCRMKEEVRSGDACTDFLAECPRREFLAIMQYLDQLVYQAVPDYEFLYYCCQHAAKLKRIGPHDPIDWDPDHPYTGPGKEDRDKRIELVAHDDELQEEPTPTTGKSQMSAVQPPEK